MSKPFLKITIEWLPDHGHGRMWLLEGPRHSTHHADIDAVLGMASVLMRDAPALEQFYEDEGDAAL